MFLGSYGDGETLLTPSLFCVTLSNHPQEEVKITHFHYAMQRHFIFIHGTTDACTTVPCVSVVCVRVLFHLLNCFFRWLTTAQTKNFVGL